MGWCPRLCFQLLSLQAEISSPALVFSVYQLMFDGVVHTFDQCRYLWSVFLPHHFTPLSLFFCKFISRFTPATDVLIRCHLCHTSCHVLVKAKNQARPSPLTVDQWNLIWGFILRLHMCECFSYTDASTCIALFISPFFFFFSCLYIFNHWSCQLLILIKVLLFFCNKAYKTLKAVCWF